MPNRNERLLPEYIKRGLTLLATTVAIAAPMLANASASILAPSAASRQHILFDSDWRFQLESPLSVDHGVPITSFRWALDDKATADAAKMTAENLDTSGPNWHDGKVGSDLFADKGGYAWCRIVLPPLSAGHRVVTMQSVDDNGIVYLNGVKLAEHQGWSNPLNVALDSAWSRSGPNILTVLVQNINGPGGIIGPVMFGTSTAPYAYTPAYDDSAWRKVHLPHDFVIEGAFTKDADNFHGSLPMGSAWYRKTFTLPASDKGRDVWLEFEGVGRNATLYLNGHILGTHESGYTDFRYDISNSALYGAGHPNVLAVHVNTAAAEGWWYDGGGIYRHVWLNVANPIHIAPHGVFVTSSVPGGNQGAHASAILTIQTTIASSMGSAPQAGSLLSYVIDPNGQVVGKAAQPLATAQFNSPLTQTIGIRQPKLWSLEAPRLYTLRSVVKSGEGSLLDTVETTFGIRTIRFDANKGFFLNGKHVEIQGFCNHQDFAGLGVALPDSMEYWRVKTLKAIGCNAWRTSHNPPNPELLDACDRLGMLVMDENRHLGDTYAASSAPGVPYANMPDLAEMIQRDRNHPSVIMWSMCNEENLEEGTPEGQRILKAMMDVVHRYDKTRPITSAMNAGWLDDGFARVEDLIGMNYYPESYPAVHARYPNVPIFGSEDTSEYSTRGVYADDKAHGFVTSYHTADVHWEPVIENPYIAGSFTWTGFDYKGEPSPYGWPNISSNYGVFDSCGFPKDDAYYFQSQWTTRPMVHLMPHWNWAGMEGQPIRVLAYTNCDHVELFLNGQSLGAKAVPEHSQPEWQVVYAPGTLEAKGYIDGKLVATDTVETTGLPAKLVLRTGRTTLIADGEDVIPVEVDVVDSQGRIVPTADNAVSFQIDGHAMIAGVGNGDPTDHDPDKANYRKAFNGKCLVDVGALETAGPARLTATSDGLESAALGLSVAAGNIGGEGSVH